MSRTRAAGRVTSHDTSDTPGPNCESEPESPVRETRAGSGAGPGGRAIESRPGAWGKIAVHARVSLPAPAASESACRAGPGRAGRRRESAPRRRGAGRRLLLPPAAPAWDAATAVTAARGLGPCRRRGRGMLRNLRLSALRRRRRCRRCGAGGAVKDKGGACVAGRGAGGRRGGRRRGACTR